MKRQSHSKANDAGLSRLRKTRVHRPLRLKPYPQRAGYCGAASLKILSGYFGKEYGEIMLARLCGTTVENGTDHDGLITGAQKIGATVFAKSGGSVRELRYFILERKLPVLVGWFLHDHDVHTDHFSVACHLSKRYIHLMDPYFKKGRRSKYGCKNGKRKMSIRNFLEQWYDFDTPENLRVERWYMVINFQGLKFSFPRGINYETGPAQ